MQDPKSLTSKKRKSDADVNLDDVEIPVDTPMDWNCNQIRGKIRTFVSNSDMTVKKFCQEIDVSDNSYYNFCISLAPTQESAVTHIWVPLASSRSASSPD